MKYLIFFVFISSLLSGVSVAQTTLDVSPKVCVVSEQHDFCDLNLQFKWRQSAVKDVCLYQQNTQIQCWQQQGSGQFSYKARVQVETIYSLINPHTGDSLASVLVEVQSAHTKKQYRLRSPWSFF
ncbi:hypothetical protein PTRA_a0975 [Pseudoalteromonas translucida KMM 520]|uniref:DUF3019 domain-containing protein n=1 Tax=Pseudoalteromonas translucida KMM 520 TaxID=1315283 RepID=A0A0U2MNA1_9GAMM|nr:DUF3019 domain-containing protein [Pseudoalteromonas translucida]ALS32260.1 hypothetical protein PTRA_a0975 [Pseudoalteromonas translucida KMM 520]